MFPAPEKKKLFSLRYLFLFHNRILRSLFLPFLTGKKSTDGGGAFLYPFLNSQAAVFQTLQEPSASPSAGSGGFPSCNHDRIHHPRPLFPNLLLPCKIRTYMIRFQYLGGQLPDIAKICNGRFFRHRPCRLHINMLFIFAQDIFQLLLVQNRKPVP